MTLPRIPSSRRLPAAVVAAALLAGACTADGDDAATTDAPPSSLAVADDNEATTSSSTTTASQASSTTTPPTSSPSTTAAKNTTTTVGGTVYDIGPASGEVLDVVGVRYDDVLNIRDQASVSGSVVATAAPFAANPQLVSGGEGLLFNPNGGAWWKVTVDGTQAWASAAFLGQVSPSSEDLFPQLSANMASTTAPDANALIDDIAAALADGPTPSVVFSTEPLGIDAIGSEATIDVIGLGDDSLKGWRIQILFNNVFDDINAANPEIVGVELTSATAFPICQRGLQGGTGLCL